MRQHKLLIRAISVSMFVGALLKFENVVSLEKVSLESTLRKSAVHVQVEIVQRFVPRRFGTTLWAIRPLCYIHKIHNNKHLKQGCTNLQKYFCQLVK